MRLLLLILAKEAKDNSRNMLECSVFLICAIFWL